MTAAGGSYEHVVRLATSVRDEALDTIRHGQVHVARVMHELCAADLEPDRDGPREPDPEVARLTLLAADPARRLSIQVSGTGRDPVIRIALSFAYGAPRVEVIDRWGPGEPGGRARRVCWVFGAERAGGEPRRITYDLDDGKALDSDGELRRQRARELARRAGWPLPPPRQR